MRRLAAVVFFLSLSVGAAALQSADPIPVDVPETRTTIDLPGGLRPAEERVARRTVRLFLENWIRYFGKLPDLRDPLEVTPTPDPGEAVFSAMWSSASGALAEADRPGARAALRLSVLQDRGGLTAALDRAARKGSFAPGEVDDVLLYAFMQDQVQDPSFLPQALPPGGSDSRVKAALSTRGMPWSPFWNRFVLWTLSRAIEARMASVSSGSLPAVWVLDAPLKPGEMTGWRFPVSDPTTGVDLQLAGEAQDGLRILSFFADDDQRVTQAGISDLKGDPMLLPRQGATLWVYLWNASTQEAGSGLTLTLWKDFTPPFMVRSAVVSGGAFDLSLSERGGIADYHLWSRSDPAGSFIPMDVPPFASEGEGEHQYHISLPGAVPSSSEFQLFCRTLSGGAYSAPVRAEGAEP